MISFFFTFRILFWGIILLPNITGQQDLPIEDWSNFLKHIEDSNTQESLIPRQIHIAFSGKNAMGYPHSMAISYNTRNATYSSVCRYGLSIDDLEQIARGISRSYLESFDHHVILPDLMPNSIYYYQCGCENTSIYSKVNHFSTNTGNSNQSVQVAFVGDLGYYLGESTKNSLAKVKQSVDFIQHLGDIAYADDWFKIDAAPVFRYEQIYNYWMNEMEIITSTTPYMVLPGNHEAECHSPACLSHLRKLARPLHNFSAYNSRWFMPYNDSKSNSNMWYSFNLGLVHFVQIDTETDFAHSPNDSFIPRFHNGGFGDQLKWLENDLAQASRERHLRKWIIVSGHRPFYSIKKNRRFDAVRQAFETLFIQYSVDLYMSGHVHGYERQFPMQQQERCITRQSTNDIYINPHCPVHITIGNAGNIEGLVKYDDKYADSLGWNAKRNDTKYGWGLLKISNASHLSWTVYNSKDMEDVLDQFWLIKHDDNQRRETIARE